MTVTPFRPQGYSSLTPFIVVTPAARAIEFYTEVFGAREVSRLEGPPLPEGLPSIGQAELDFGDGRLQLSDPSPEYGLAAPDPEAPTTNSLVLYVEDVDAVFARAVAAGAAVREEVSDFVSGDRYGVVVDPFGRRWAIMTRVEQLSEEESERRVQEWWSSISGAGV